MNCFLTGANGFIGLRLAERLALEGHGVRCLVRSPEKFSSLSHLPGVTAVTGDLDDISALQEGVSGCDTVFHLAAYAKPWSSDKGLPYRVNVTGTENLLKACLVAGVKRLVFTSSAAVIGPSPGIEPIDEDFPRTVPRFNEYEETKAEAEELVRSYNRDGLETVTVNPTRVYGPGVLSESNSVTLMIKLYARGKWHIIPGDGKCIGNYVIVDDVVNGHILAALHGHPGHRYALGGDNLTFDQFFKTLTEVTGKRPWLIHLPVWLMITIAKILEWQASVTGIPPLITAPWVRKYLNHWSLSSAKAAADLGYSYSSFREGARITLDWITSEEERS
ncbi:MAG: SDR family oxidoreductase [Bacteroidales bacterium]|nr:SDR family oxidoreductase [Bacteroidales bacterium]MDT8374805.1 SDR family oxidoreductase [Bacteroidales bacterium]